MNTAALTSKLRRLLSNVPGLGEIDRQTWAPLVGGALVVLGVTAIAQLLALGLQILFARLLGPVEFGVYGFVFAGLGLCLIVSKMGLDTTLIRLVAGFAASNDPGRLLGLVRFARTTGPAVGIIVGLVAIGIVKSRAQPEASSLYQSVLMAALLLPLAVFSELTAAALRGLRRVGAALAGDGIVRPVVAGAGILLVSELWPGDLTSSVALLLYLVGTVVSLAVTGMVLRRVLPRATAIADASDIGRYLRVALSLMVASGFLGAMYSLDTVMVGLLSNTTNAGFYSVASRIAIFVLFVMNASQAVAAPMLSAATISRNPVEVRNVVRVLNGLSIAAAVPASIVLMIIAEPVMEAFGPEFREAAPALRILVLSQLLNVLTGPTGLVLSMTGQEKSLALLLALGLAVNVILNVFWIPAFGIVGAAASALVAHATWNVLGVIRIRAQVGIDVTPLDLFRRH